MPYTYTKTESFNDLLSTGTSIAVTHSTFLSATQATAEKIQRSNYTLILDEVLDVIRDFNQIRPVEQSPRQMMTRCDIQTLMDKHMIEVDENFKVSWCDRGLSPESKFYEVMRVAKSGRLYLARLQMLVTIFPPEIFLAFENAYILTYMFDGSILKTYFDLFHIPYRKATVLKKAGCDERYLSSYIENTDTMFREQCKDLIQICDNPRLNRPGRSLSSSWYHSATASQLKDLKNDMGTFFHRILPDARAKRGDIMWTCPKDFRDRLTGKGYTCSRRMTAYEKSLPQEKQNTIAKELSCFVPCNAKATNTYRTRWALAYCCNISLNPLIRGMLDEFEVSFNDDAFALSNLIQWMCRSRIRTGQHICIYLPSTRIRNLFTKWLDC